MINVEPGTHIEKLFTEMKRGYWPTVDGEQEKALRIAFLQGIHCGTRLFQDALDMDSDEVSVTFLRDVRQQIFSGLMALGTVPGRVSVGTQRPTNGEVSNG
jgi:hypothetical protein